MSSLDSSNKSLLQGKTVSPLSFKGGMLRHSKLVPALTLVLCSSAAMANPPVIAPEKPEANLLDDLDLYDRYYEPDYNVPLANDPFTKLIGTVHEKLANKGVIFYVEQAFNQSWINHPMPGSRSDQTWYLLHVHAAINLIESTRNQGTWLKAELSGSSALNGHSEEPYNFNNAFGASAPVHSDIFEDGIYYFPEILVSQGFAGGKGVFMIGMVDQTNYFDTNSYANSSFGQFTNAVFVNNRVLPLVSANLGVVLQGQFSDSWYGQIGSSMTDNGLDQNPFKHSRGRNFNIVGEVGWTNDNVLGFGSGTYRIQPFMFHNEGQNVQAGIALNLEQDLGRQSPFAVYSRTGWSQAGEGNLGGAAFQASAGLIVKKPLESMGIMKEGDGNFFGVSFAVTKPDGGSLAEGRDPSRREYTLECTYCFAITRYLSIQPTFQYVANPAGRADVNSISVFAVQSIFYF